MRRRVLTAFFGTRHNHVGGHGPRKERGAERGREHCQHRERRESGSAPGLLLRTGMGDAHRPGLAGKRIGHSRGRCQVHPGRHGMDRMGQETADRCVLVRSYKPRERQKLADQIEPQRCPIAYRTALDHETDRALHGEGGADMQQVEGAVGTAGRRLGEQLADDSVAEHGACTDGGNDDPRQPGGYGPAQHESELRDEC